MKFLIGMFPAPHKLEIFYPKVADVVIKASHRGAMVSEFPIFLWI